MTRIKVLMPVLAALLLLAVPSAVGAHPSNAPDCGGDNKAVLGDRADWAAVELVGWVLRTDCLLDSGNRDQPSLPASTMAAYDDQSTIVVGGTAAVPASKLSELRVDRRLAGGDRLETMREVVEWADEQLGRGSSPVAAPTVITESGSGDAAIPVTLRVGVYAVSFESPWEYSNVRLTHEDGDDCFRYVRAGEREVFVVHANEDCPSGKMTLRVDASDFRGTKADWTVNIEPDLDD